MSVSALAPGCRALNSRPYFTAVSSGTSSILSFSMALTSFAAMQLFKQQLSGSEYMTIVGGLLGSTIFFFVLVVSFCINILYMDCPKTIFLLKCEILNVLVHTNSTFCKREWLCCFHIFYPFGQSIRQNSQNQFPIHHDYLYFRFSFGFSDTQTLPFLLFE